MTAYAQNASGGGFASLTSSLLARKGEALPAVDAVAHEGVDIDIRPVQAANSAPAHISYNEEKTEERLMPEQQQSVRLVHSGQPAQQTDVPDIWSLPRAPRQRVQAGRPVMKRAPTKPATPNGPYRDLLNRKATVTLKMPSLDLVRLRIAARDLEMSCQSIIIEALECYLDANGVPRDDNDPEILRETERMIKRARSRRQR